MIDQVLALTLAATLAATSPPADPLPAGAFGWIGELAGSCWTGVHPDGATRDTQCYSSQYGRFLRGTIEIAAAAAAGGPSERPPYRGDSVFTWDPERSELTFIYWGSRGNHGRSTGRIEDERIVFDMAPSTDPDAPPRRAVWTRVGPDSCRCLYSAAAARGGRTNLP